MLSIIVVVALFGCVFALPPDPNCGNPVIPPDLGNTLLNGRIVGGKEVVQNSWPWQIQLLYNGGHYCGGSLVSADTFVTAAHCVFRTSPTVFSCRAGHHAKNGVNQPFMQTSAVSQIVIHESYNPVTINNDVAIVRLSSPFTRTAQVSPVCLPPNTNEIATNTLVHVTGWGAVENTCCATVLKQVEVPIIDRPTCNLPASYGGSVTAAMICAGFMAGGYDSCQGDSGGPLVAPNAGNGGAWTLQGIVSWGSGCADRNKPGVYTNVPYLRQWILNQVTLLDREEALVNQKFRPIPFGAAFRELTRDLVEKGEIRKSDLPMGGEWME